MASGLWNYRVRRAVKGELVREVQQTLLLPPNLVVLSFLRAFPSTAMTDKPKAAPKTRRPRRSRPEQFLTLVEAMSFAELKQTVVVFVESQPETAEFFNAQLAARLANGTPRRTIAEDAPAVTVNAVNQPR